MATTTLTGTTGNDVLNSSGSVSTLVQGLQGVDTITLSLADDSAEAGKGADLISLTATGNHTSNIRGGTGNDTVALSGATTFAGYINLGAGGDSLSINSATSINNATIYASRGSDTLRLQNTIVNSTIGGGSGTDILSFTAANAITTSKISGGKKQDTITITNATGSFSTINGGKGSDVINLSGAAALANTLVGGGKGTDSISAGNSAVGSIAGGGLADTITLLTAFGGGRIYGDGVGVTTAGTGTGGAADGADSISMANALGAATSIYGGGGKDTIAFLSQTGDASAAVIDGGNGDDSISFGLSSVGDVFRVGTVTGGAGADTISLTTSYSGVSTIANVGTISGGDGTDLIIFNATAGYDYAAGADMNTTSSFSQGNYQAVISGASGDTVRIAITANTGAANWGAIAPTVFIASALSGLSAGLTAVNAAGSIGVFSDGTDSVIMYNDAVSSAYQLFLKGFDITATTAVGSLSLTASNVNFSVSANTSGTNITFS